MILNISLWWLTDHRTPVEAQKGNPQWRAVKSNQWKHLLQNILLCYRILVFSKWSPETALDGAEVLKFNQNAYILGNDPCISLLLNTWPSNFRPKGFLRTTNQILEYYHKAYCNQQGPPAWPEPPSPTAIMLLQWLAANTCWHHLCQSALGRRDWFLSRSFLTAERLRKDQLSFSGE